MMNAIEFAQAVDKDDRGKQLLCDVHDALRCAIATRDYRNNGVCIFVTLVVGDHSYTDAELTFAVSALRADGWKHVKAQRFNANRADGPGHERHKIKIVMNCPSC